VSAIVPVCNFSTLSQFVDSATLSSSNSTVDVTRYRSGPFFLISTEGETRLIQGDSLARGPKLLSIKNYVIEIMT